MDFDALEDAFTDLGVTVNVAEDKAGQFAGFRATSDQGAEWDDSYSLEALFGAIIDTWKEGSHT